MEPVDSSVDIELVSKKEEPSVELGCQVKDDESYRESPTLRASSSPARSPSYTLPPKQVYPDSDDGGVTSGITSKRARCGTLGFKSRSESQSDPSENK